MKNATAVNGRVPGTFEPLDIERFRLRAEVAKLQLEAAKRWLTPAARPNCNGKSTCWTTRFSV